jgi:hypothetical protein
VQALDVQAWVSVQVLKALIGTCPDPGRSAVLVKSVTAKRGLDVGDGRSGGPIGGLAHVVELHRVVHRRARLLFETEPRPGPKNGS